MKRSPVSLGTIPGALLSAATVLPVPAPLLIHRLRTLFRPWLIVAAALLVAAAGEAAYLTNVPQKVSQPDGTVLHLFATGDEYYNWLHDADGYVIVRDPANGVLVYATKVDGQLRPTNLVVGRSDPAAAGLEKGLKPDRRFIPDPRTLFPGPMVARALGTPGVPSFSSINNIVVFIRFADEAEFSAPISTYDGLFNSTVVGVNSLRNYYREVSYQQLTVTSTFYPTPSGGYVVSYRDSQPRSYYKPYDATTNPGGYDKNSTAERLRREFALLANAVNAIAPQVPSSLNLDTNGDGKVDNVCFVISGGAVQADWGNLLWPHRYWMHYAYSGTATINSKTVDDYNVQLYDQLTVGVLCHEMTHTLGAPDLYHYNESSKDLSPVWKWDLMGVNSDPPEHMGAYMKYKYLGWVPSIPQISTSGTYSLQPLISATNNCYKIASPNSSTEYFLVEYRRKTGTFESSVPGSGLLVYRIKTDIPASQSGNDYGPPDEVYIYRPGGSTTLNGYPGSANLGTDVQRPAINDRTDPSSFLSDGSPGGLSISNIGSGGGTISFTVTLGGGGGATTTIFSDDFEGAFPGNWHLWRSTGSATTEWGKVTCTSGSGSGSAWCAAGGSAPQPGCSQYIGNMNSWMIYGPFSLADASEAWAEFDLWFDTEVYNDSTKEGDRIWWIISIDGQNYSGYYKSGSSGGWQHKVFNFKDITSFSAIGSANVWFAFAFQSDAYIQGGGAYFDNVVIRKTVAAACAYSISPTSQSSTAAGGTGTVNVTVTSGSNCSWAATSNAGWITVTGGASGTGNGTVSYSVAANTGGARSGTLTIAGQTFAVSQDALSCSYSITPSSASIAAAAGTGTVTVTAPAGCSWTAVSNAGWISITSGASGSGNGSVGYSVSANTGGARTGTLTIAGQTFTVSQAAPPCSYAINPTQQAFGYAGGAGTVNVTVTSGSNCSWAATSNAGWITVTGGASGTGNGMVSYLVAANTGGARSGTLTIAGQTFTANQDALTCSYSISPSSASLAAVGGTGSVAVTAPTGCSWTATSNAGWISVTSGATGSGNASATYSVQANTAAARLGTLTVAGQTLTVSQAAPACSFSISPTQQAFGYAGGTGSVSVTAGPGCSWSSWSNSAWITITGGTSGTGNGAVSYSVAANTGGARTGTLTIAGQTFAVNQDALNCSNSITPSSASVSAMGGTGSVAVTAPAACSWSAASNAGWISVTSGASGSGNGNVAYSVQANTGGARTGTLTIAGQTFTVSQAAPACSYSISPAQQAFGYAGGTGFVSVTADSGCMWNSWSNVAWITLTANASGAGNGTVRYLVATNAGGARSGTLTIGTQTFTVNQDAFTCSYSISPSSASVVSAGGSGSFAVVAASGCGWVASSDSGWIQISAGISGSGDGTVYFDVHANTGAARSGRISVQEQIFTVSQAAGNVDLGFSHWIAAVSHVDGANNSHWRSDVAVLNRSSMAATLEYRLYSPEGLQTQRVTLAGNAQDFRKDIAAWLGYWTGSASLEIRSDQDVFVMGRTYNQVDAIHTYGQNYDGQDATSGLLSAGQSAWLPLLAQNVDFRCNIAITNTGPTTASVTLTLYDGRGNQLWSGSDESSALPSGGFVQYLKPFQKYTGRNDLEHSYAKVTVNTGSGIIAWASVVDENTGDPTTIFMQR